MTDLNQAIAAAREALTFFDSAPERSFAEQSALLDCVGALRDILAAIEAAEVPVGMVMVRRADLEALASTDFGASRWTDRAELAARRIRDGLAANKENTND